MADNLVIIGAGGHGKVIADAAYCSQQFESIVFLDAQYQSRSEQLGFSVIGNDGLISELVSKKCSFVVAIGDNRIRAAKYVMLSDTGAEIAKVIHPRAIISESVTIGKGSVVLAGAIINADTNIGDNVIVNTGCVIEHDNLIGSHAHVAPGSVLTGNCQLGELSLFGAGAVSVPGKRIGTEVVVGSGAVVVGDIPDGKTAVGIPAKW